MEMRQNLFNMSHMLLKSIREDKDIIQIDDAEDIEEIIETIIGIGLEECKGISETKGHNEVFKVTIAGTECSFIFIAFYNLELVICICDIQADEIFHIFEIIKSSEMSRSA